MKRILIVIGLLLVVAGVVVGALPVSAETRGGSVSCGSAFFSKDSDLLVLPRPTTRTEAVMACDDAVGSRAPVAWVLLGLGVVAVVAGALIRRPTTVAAGPPTGGL